MLTSFVRWWPVTPFNATLMMRCENLKPLRPYLEVTFPRLIRGRGAQPNFCLGLKLQVHESDTDERRPSKHLLNRVRGISGVHEWKTNRQDLNFMEPLGRWG